MRGKRIAIGATVAALAVTGTAVAAGSGSIGPFGDDRKQQLAEDLAGELEGVNPNQVENALDAVAEQRMQEHRGEMAAAIAAELDGVGAGEVEAALDDYEESVRESLQNGERPNPDGLASALAERLEVSEEEITAALEASREKQAEAHREEALERLDAAVEDGTLSEEQADQIRERIESGGGPGHGGPGHGPGGPGGPGFGPPPGGPPSAGGSGEGEGTSAPYLGVDPSAA